MAQQLGLTTLSVDAVFNEYTVTVADATGFVVGQHFRIINSAADRFYQGTILGIATNVITLDSPMDFAYVDGSEVTISNINMAVDGSVTPVIFTLRTGSPSIPSSVDITRMIAICEADSAIDLSLFCNVPALTRGVLLRSTNGITDNIYTVKSNRDIAGVAFDFTPFVATNPSQGVDGFVTRLTFAGQSKIGVALRVAQDGNIEAWVQDDLTGLVFFSIILEGHGVLN
jgi:hypothetical protein